MKFHHNIPILILVATFHHVTQTSSWTTLQYHHQFALSMHMLPALAKAGGSRRW